jgi:hypothetical protein
MFQISSINVRSYSLVIRLGVCVSRLPQAFNVFSETHFSICAFQLKKIELQIGSRKHFLQLTSTSQQCYANDNITMIQRECCRYLICSMLFSGFKSVRVHRFMYAKGLGLGLKLPIQSSVSRYPF